MDSMFIHSVKTRIIVRFFLGGKLRVQIRVKFFLDKS